MPDAKIPFFSFPVLGNLGPEYNGINAKNRQHGGHYDLHGKLTTGPMSYRLRSRLGGNTLYSQHQCDQRVLIF